MWTNLWLLEHKHRRLRRTEEISRSECLVAYLPQFSNNDAGREILLISPRSRT